MTPPFLVAMLIPAFGACVIYRSAWPLAAWLFVLMVSAMFWRGR